MSNRQLLLDVIGIMKLGLERLDFLSVLGRQFSLDLFKLGIDLTVPSCLESVNLFRVLGLEVVLDPLQLRSNLASACCFQSLDFFRMPGA